MSKPDISRLERNVIKYAMLRLKSWKKEYPQGLLPFGTPGGIRRKDGWHFVNACLELEKARGENK